jgi:hypothetical protein
MVAGSWIRDGNPRVVKPVKSSENCGVGNIFLACNLPNIQVMLEKGHQGASYYRY